MPEYSKAALKESLESKLDESIILEDEPMSLYTTFEIGGLVDFMVEPTCVEEIIGAIEAAKEANAPYWIIGCGSDLLISDAGLRGLAIHLGEGFSKIEVDGNRITAQAGATNKKIAEKALECSLAGYEFASGIPGSIGGAAIMNAGAYDGELKNVATEVVCLDADLNMVTLSNEQAQWGYRKSLMAEEGYVVLQVTIELADSDRDSIQARMDELKEKRESKQPLEYPSAGSTFKRPVGYYAGKLIDDAGMRGHRVGGACVSQKHAGFVINDMDATAADVMGVIEDVQEAVLTQFGVTLETEVKMLGFEEGNVPAPHACKTHKH